MKQVTVAMLRELTRALAISLDDEELARLRPMVEDLLLVAQRLREYQPDFATEQGPGPGPTASGE